MKILCLLFSLMVFAASAADFQADDGSFIHPLPSLQGVETVLCTLPPGWVIRACRHKTVGQIWYVTGGRGEMWLKNAAGHEMTFPLTKGVSFTVPLGEPFQFRNIGEAQLSILIVNTSPWTGEGELIPVEGRWPENFSRY